MREGHGDIGGEGGGSYDKKCFKKCLYSLQTNKNNHVYINTIAWKPSVAQFTHSNCHRLPALGRFYRETKFLLLKSIHSI